MSKEQQIVKIDVFGKHYEENVIRYMSDGWLLKFPPVPVTSLERIDGHKYQTVLFVFERTKKETQTIPSTR